MQKYKEEFIEFLVRSGALKFGDFTLKSGRKCPYFLNFGQFNKGSSIMMLGKYYAAAIHDRVKDFEVVFGPAYKGIPIAVATCGALAYNFQNDASYAFNRKEAKDHGEKSLIVGAPINHETKLVIVDDVMTAGTALRESLEILKQCGDPQVQGVFIAVDRMEKGQGSKSAIQEVKDEFGIDVFAIVTLDELVEHLSGREIDGQVVIDAEKMVKIKVYRDQYGV